MQELQLFCRTSLLQTDTSKMVGIFFSSPAGKLYYHRYRGAVEEWVPHSFPGVVSDLLSCHRERDPSVYVLSQGRVYTCKIINNATTLLCHLTNVVKIKSVYGSELLLITADGRLYSFANNTLTLQSLPYPITDIYQSTSWICLIGLEGNLIYKRNINVLESYLVNLRGVKINHIHSFEELNNVSTVLFSDSIGNFYKAIVSSGVLTSLAPYFEKGFMIKTQIINGESFYLTETEELYSIRDTPVNDIFHFVLNYNESTQVKLIAKDVVDFAVDYNNECTVVCKNGDTMFYKGVLDYPRYILFASENEKIVKAVSVSCLLNKDNKLYSSALNNPALMGADTYSKLIFKPMISE